MSGMPKPPSPGGIGMGMGRSPSAAKAEAHTTNYTRTAAKTGTTFDMADLLTHGHATKVPKKVLPSTDQKMLVLGQTEQTMPGDLMGVTRPKSVVERICKQIRDRNLDLLNLMDDFQKRPRGSRMPVRNRAFVNVSDFRRALCYAMGDQWIGMSMTSEEFASLYAPYVRTDAGHESRLTLSRTDGVGAAEPLILWQQFARDVQLMADGTGLSEAQQILFDAEQALADKAAKAAKAAEAQLDADANFGQAKSGMMARRAEKEKLMKEPVGKRGCTIGQVEAAKKVIMNTLVGPGGRHDTIREALKDLDESADGTLQREEIVTFLRENYIYQYTDFYTGQLRGAIAPAVCETLLDLVDKNGDGVIKYDEFAGIVMAGANTYHERAEHFEQAPHACTHMRILTRMACARHACTGTTRWRSRSTASPLSDSEHLGARGRGRRRGVLCGMAAMRRERRARRGGSPSAARAPSRPPGPEDECGVRVRASERGGGEGARAWR